MESITGIWLPQNTLWPLLASWMRELHHEKASEDRTDFINFHSHLRSGKQDDCTSTDFHVGTKDIPWGVGTYLKNKGLSESRMRPHKDTQASKEDTGSET